MGPGHGHQSEGRLPLLEVRAPRHGEARAWDHRERLVGLGVLGSPGFGCLWRLESRASVDDEVHGPRTCAGWDPGQRDLSRGGPYPDDGGGRAPAGPPLRRILSATLRSNPDGIARSILFLASDESSFMTGAALSVDGGSTAR